MDAHRANRGAEHGRGTAGRTAGPGPGRGTGVADEIDFKIFGAEMQFVEVELDPGESAVAEAGAMMYKDGSVKMETVLGMGPARTAVAASWASFLGPVNGL